MTSLTTWLSILAYHFINGVRAPNDVAGKRMALSVANLDFDVGASTIRANDAMRLGADNGDASTRGLNHLQCLPWNRRRATT